MRSEKKWTIKIISNFLFLQPNKPQEIEYVSRMAGWTPIPQQKNLKPTSSYKIFLFRSLTWTGDGFMWFLLQHFFYLGLVLLWCGISLFWSMGTLNLKTLIMRHLCLVLPQFKTLLRASCFHLKHSIRLDMVDGKPNLPSFIIFLQSLLDLKNVT